MKKNIEKRIKGYVHRQILFNENREEIESIVFNFRGQKLYSSNSKHFLILVCKIFELEDQIEDLKKEEE